MKLVTEQDVQLHEKRQAFLKKFFKKTYEKFGEAGFVTLDNPPRQNDALAEHLSSRYGYAGRLFRLDGKWYFPKEYLNYYDQDKAYRSRSSEAELKVIANVYHSEEEEFIVTALRDVKFEGGNGWVKLAGYSLFVVKDNSVVEKLCADDAVEILSMHFRKTPRATYIMKGSQFMVKLPCAMVTEREYHKKLYYDINTVVYFGDYKPDWKIQPRKKVAKDVVEKPADSDVLH